MRTLAVGIRLTLLLTVVGGALSLTWWLTGDPVLELARAVSSRPPSSGTWTVDKAVGDGAAALCLVAVAGLATGVALSAAAVLPGSRAGWLSTACGRLAPRAGRRLVAACCGIGLVAPGVVALPAMADGGSPHQACHGSCRAEPTVLAGLSLPDLPTGRGSGAIVVHHGDSLWLIATRHLPAGASAAAIEHLTRQLYALNRSTIGSDPDLILPGTTLITTEGRP